MSQKPLAFGLNVIFGHKRRSYLTLYQQVKAGLDKVDDDSIVYLCEHDVFYHPDQFKFVPPNRSLIYFNLNRYYWQSNAKYFLKTIGKRALSQCVSHKQVLLDHVKEQIQGRIENRPTFCTGPFENFETENPNIDIRHAHNFTANRFSKDQYRSQRSIKGWKLADEVPFWGKTKGRFDEFLYETLIKNE